MPTPFSSPLHATHEIKPSTIPARANTKTLFSMMVLAPPGCVSKSYIDNTFILNITFVTVSKNQEYSYPLIVADYSVNAPRTFVDQSGIMVISANTCI